MVPSITARTNQLIGRLGAYAHVYAGIFLNMGRFSFEHSRSLSKGSMQKECLRSRRFHIQQVSNCSAPRVDQASFEGGQSSD